MRRFRGDDLSGLALRGSAWTVGGFGLQRLLQLVSNLILSRLLFPEAFGLMAIVHVVVSGLELISDVGIRPSIIQNRRGEDASFLNTAWTIQILRGFALWAVALLIARPVAGFYGEPLLFPLLCVVSATAAIRGFQSTAMATANRRLELARITMVPLAAQALAIVAMVAFALVHRSVWALALGAMVASAATTVLSHLVLPSHGHALRLEAAARRALFGFGRWIFLSTLLTFCAGQGLRLIQGALVSTETLGLIAIAGAIAWALSDLAQRLMSAVAFPALSRIARDNPARFTPVLWRIRRNVLAISIPGFAAVSLAANPLIDLLFDDRYLSAGPFLALLAIAAATAMLSGTFGDAFLASGDSRSIFLISLVGALFRVSALALGFELAGVPGMLIGPGVANLVTYLFVAVLANRRGWLALWSLDLPVIAVIILFASFSVYINDV